MAGFFAPKKLENHTSEGSMRKGDKEKARRKKGISTLAEKKKRNCSTEELYSAKYTFMLLFAEDLLAPSSTLTNKQFFFFFFFFLLFDSSSSITIS